MTINHIKHVSLCILIFASCSSCGGTGSEVKNPFDNSIVISMSNAGSYFNVSIDNLRQDGNYLYAEATFSLMSVTSYHITEKCSFNVNADFYFKYFVGDSYTKTINKDIFIDVGGTTKTETITAYVDNANFVVESNVTLRTIYASGKIKPN